MVTLAHDDRKVHPAYDLSLPGHLALGQALQAGRTSYSQSRWEEGPRVDPKTDAGELMLQTSRVSSTDSTH